MANFANNRTMRIGSIPLQFPPAVARKKKYTQMNGQTKNACLHHLSNEKHSTDVQRQKMVFISSTLVTVITLLDISLER